MGYRNDAEEFLKVMTSRTFVKSAIFDETFNTLIVNYYNSFGEFKEINPNSSLTERDYINYFSTNEKIEKVIVLEPARILRDFDHIENVILDLTFEGTSYYAEVHREKLNKLIGFDIKELSPVDGTWRERFSDVYGYGKENEKRRYLFNNFVIIG